MTIINPTLLLQDKEKFDKIYPNIEKSYSILSRTNIFPNENTYNKVMSSDFLQDMFIDLFNKTKNGKTKYENLVNEAKEKEFHVFFGCSYKSYLEKVSQDIDFKKGNVSAIYDLESLDVGFSKNEELMNESKHLYQNVRKELSLNVIADNIRKITEPTPSITSTKSLGLK